MGVAVLVSVLVAVAVLVGVNVAVGVIVGVWVGVGVIPSTVVVMVTALFASLDSSTMLAGSIVAVLPTTRSVSVTIRPVIVIVATALGPTPNAPRSQSSVPPVTPSSSEHTPRVVVNPRYWKFAAGSSITRTEAAGADPMLRA